MGISLILLGSGLLTLIIGIVLLAIQKTRKIAVACVVIGIGLIVIPSIFIIVNDM